MALHPSSLPRRRGGGFPSSLPSNRKTLKCPSLRAPSPSQRLMHSGMALFPPQPSDNIKIQNGQLNPSSVSDLIVMVLPAVPGRAPPLPTLGLYDTKWPGYSFSIYSKNSVNNSMGMRRPRSPNPRLPQPLPRTLFRRGVTAQPGDAAQHRKKCIRVN